MAWTSTVPYLSSQSPFPFSPPGIYVRELVEAVPLDKYFELYKPGTGAEGGFIRVSVNFLQADQVPAGMTESSQRLSRRCVMSEAPRRSFCASSASSSHFPLVPLVRISSLSMGVGVVVAAFALTRFLRSR